MFRVIYIQLMLNSLVCNFLARAYQIASNFVFERVFVFGTLLCVLSVLHTALKNYEININYLNSSIQYCKCD